MAQNSKTHLNGGFSISSGKRARSIEGGAGGHRKRLSDER